MIAGSASTGSASRMPNTSTDDAVMPGRGTPAGTPPRTSIAYCSAPAAATPPGTTRPKAFEASCEVTTGPQRSRAQRQPLHAPTCSRSCPPAAASIATNQSGFKSASRGNAPNTSSRPGASR